MEVELLRLNQALVHHLSSHNSEVRHRTIHFLLVVNKMLTWDSISRLQFNKMLLLVLHQIHLATHYLQKHLILFKKQRLSAETTKLHLKGATEQ